MEMPMEWVVTLSGPPTIPRTPDVEVSASGLLGLTPSIGRVGELQANSKTGIYKDFTPPFPTHQHPDTQSHIPSLH
ncbi:hypothetical protein V490_05247 [Pseudogymnoascus sp. VKM F-3557]|nr:hypothetical protein V490_05247 [Pseudogymnoascus sp. VKM F-3557]